MKKKSLILVAVMAMASVAGAGERKPDAVMQKNKERIWGANHLSLELGGRGMFYSVNYDRYIGRHVALGAGFSYMGLETQSYGRVPLTVVPIYSNFYAGVKAHRPYLTGGVSVAKLHGEGSPTVDGMVGVFPSFGAGYEYRSDEGFIFRATPYVALMPKATGWLGVTFGGSF